jgi:hypothetical protein
MVLVLSVGATELATDFRRAAAAIISVRLLLGSVRDAPDQIVHMDASIISALAALTGAAVGGFTNVFANWLSHRVQARAQSLQHEKNRRQILYRDFIDEASKCYIDALQHGEADISGLVGLYAKLSRMRILSSERVVRSADNIVRKILDTYLEPDRTFVELRNMASNGTIDLLHEFSSICREEFDDIQAHQF